jgi:hypothetical protein
LENVEAPYRIRVADFGVTSAKAEPSDEQRVSLSPRRVRVCVFITAVPITKLFAWGEGDRLDPVTGTGSTLSLGQGRPCHWDRLDQPMGA